MSKDDKKFEVDDSYNKENPFSIGKILASIFFIVVGIFLVMRVFAVYKNALISALIILAVGFILLTIWYKRLYIYRYMLPAMIIIVIFTAYPIIYTIYIAFTNFGTGHMFSKEKVREMLSNEKWDVDYDNPPLFAEFYGPKDQIKAYMEAYKKSYDEFLKKVENWEKQKKSDAYIDEMWDAEFYAKKYPKLTSDYLSKIKLEDFAIVLYSQNKIRTDVGVVDSDSDSYDNEEDDNTLPVKVYLFDASTIGKEISLDDIDKYTANKVLLGSSIYERASLEKAELELSDGNTLGVFIDDIKNVYVGLKDLTPLVIKGETKDGRDSNYLIETSNQFFSKMHSFKVENRKMQRLNPETFEYDDANTVYEDPKEGRFVLTKDAQPVKFWKEYKLSKLKFDYGLLNLETDSAVEGYLSKKFSETGIADKIDELDLSGIVGLPIKDVDQAKLKDLNIRLIEINKEIANFNKNKSKYRKEFITESEKRINSEYPELPDFIDAEVMVKKILPRIDNYQDSSFFQFYYNVMPSLDKFALQMDKINISDEEVFKGIQDKLWTLLTKSKIYDLEKERNKIKNSLKKQKFPEYADVKLVQFETSNIDENVAIEPGYSIWIGGKNFQKIASSENITTPFMFVFLWTIAWAALSVLTSFAAGLALALVFNASDFKGKYFYRTLFVLPYAIPSFVTILMWSGFLNKDFGVINGMLGRNIPWLMDGTLAKISVLTVNLWLSFPYFMIISLGALQSIDSSMYEAADVDGATRVQQFSMITLPLLLMALGPMLVGSFAFAFNNFGGIYLLTGGGPTMAAGVLPGHTDILISYTYKLAFGPQDKNYGLASAIAIIVFLIIGTLTFLQFKFTGTFKEVDNA